MSEALVVDYGVGNLHSVVKALAACGATVKVSDSGAEVSKAQRLVLPGVGAFADGMRGLTERGLVEPLRAYAASGRPFLGICLGMQMLFRESSEFGRHEGLGIIAGAVVEISAQPGLKVPHVGWNRITPRPSGTWEGTVLQEMPLGTMTYFVHSFYAVPEKEEHRLADTQYGAHRLSAAVQAGKVVGCQFHPEKSGPTGLSVLRRFLTT